MITDIIATTSPDGAYEFGYWVGAILGGVILLGSPILFIWSLYKYCKGKKKPHLVLLIVSAIPVGLIFLGLALGILRSMRVNELYVDQGTELPIDEAYIFPESNLAIAVPSHWTVMKNLNIHANVQFGNLRREEYLIFFQFSKLDYDWTVRSLADMAVAELKDSIEDGIVESNAEISLLGRVGYQFEVSGMSNQVKLNYLDTVFEGKDHFYRILAWTLPSKKERAFKVFSDVLGSVSEQ